MEALSRRDAPAIQAKPVHVLKHGMEPTLADEFDGAVVLLLS